MRTIVQAVLAGVMAGAVFAGPAARIGSFSRVRLAELRGGTFAGEELALR